MTTKPVYPDQNKIHLDSTNLGSSLTTAAWSLDLEDQALIRQREAAAKGREAVEELKETVLAWLTCLYCWARNIFDPMSKNRLDSLTKKVGTQLFGAIACLEELEEANRELNRVYAAGEALADQAGPSLDHLSHYWADDSHEESEPSAEPIKGTLEENTLLIPPKLAAAIGLHEATVLSQMQYWLNKGAGELVNGIRWMWNTLDDWLKQFPFFSKWQLRKALHRLRDDLGLVEFKQRRKHEWDRTGWYTINYQRLKALQLSMCESPHVDVWSPTDRRVTVHTSYRTETSSKTSPKTTAPAAAVLNFEEEKSRPDSNVSLVNHKKLASGVSEVVDEDKSSALALVSVEKVDLVQAVGIPLNPQLKRTLMNYALEQVKAAVDHYRATNHKKGKPHNPSGWLTECLKGQWADASKSAAVTEVAHPSSKESETKLNLRIENDLQLWRFRWDTYPAKKPIIRQEIQAAYPGGEIFVADTGPMRG